MSVLVANAVVDTDQPRLQVGENQMDDRQVLLGNLWITTLGNSEVLIAALTRVAQVLAPTPNPPSTPESPNVSNSIAIINLTRQTGKADD